MTSVIAASRLPDDRFDQRMNGPGMVWGDK